LRGGMPADIVILTSAIVANLAEEKLVVAASIADVGLVETALAVRAGDPQVAAGDPASLRDTFLASDAIFVPDTSASTAGIHVATPDDRSAPCGRRFPGSPVKPAADRFKVCQNEFIY